MSHWRLERQTCRGSIGHLDDRGGQRRSIGHFDDRGGRRRSMHRGWVEEGTRRTISACTSGPDAEMSLIILPLIKVQSLGATRHQSHHRCRAISHTMVNVTMSLSILRQKTIRIRGRCRRSCWRYARLHARTHDASILSRTLIKDSGLWC